MQATSTDDLINLYLTDETKLYQDWYASIQPRYRLIPIPHHLE